MKHDDEGDEGNQSSNGLALGHLKHRNHVPPGQAKKEQNPPPRGWAFGHRDHVPPGQAKKEHGWRGGDDEGNEDRGGGSDGSGHKRSHGRGHHH
jgi:hypothetical protein